MPPFKTSELKAEHAVMTAQIGAQVLSEIYKALTNNGMSTDLAAAVLASAVSGCLRTTDLTPEEFFKGVAACNEFWSVEDENVVFLGMDIKQAEEQLESLQADDGSKN